MFASLSQRGARETIVPVDGLDRILRHQIEHDILAMNMQDIEFSHIGHGVEHHQIIRHAELAIGLVVHQTKTCILRGEEEPRRPGP